MLIFQISSNGFKLSFYQCHASVIKPQLAIARLRLHASMMSSVHLFLSVCLFICRQHAKNANFSKTKQFGAMVSIDNL